MGAAGAGSKRVFIALLPLAQVRFRQSLPNSAMGEGPDVQPSRPREDSSKPTAQPGESNVQNKQEKRDKRSPVEVVAECPQIRRQLLFTRPFTVYDDVIDAAQQKNGKQEKEVPAIHFLLDTTDDGSRLCVGGEDGKKLGWVNRDDNAGYEWNIRSVWRPGPDVLPNGSIPLFVTPDRAVGSVEVQINKNTLLPIFETREDKNGDTWYKVGASLTGGGPATKIGKPLWVPQRDNGRVRLNNSDGNVLVTQQEIKEFERSLKFVLAAWDSSPSNEKSSPDHVDALRLCYARLLGLKTKGAALTQDDSERLARYFGHQHSLQLDFLNKYHGPEIEDFMWRAKLMRGSARTLLDEFESANHSSSPSLQINGQSQTLRALKLF